MSFDLQQAKAFLTTTSLPAKPELFGVATGLGMPVLETAEQQSLVVGSNVLSFTPGVDAKLKQAITDSSLFAQLAATQAVGQKADPLAFFDAYFANLATLGWQILNKETAQLSYKEDDFDVHQAIIGVITSFLSPVAGAAAVVLAVLDGLHKMDADAPFITLFNQQSQHGEMGRFQLTYVHAKADGGVSAEAMAFAVNADRKVTQVLFFKLQTGTTLLRRSTGSLSIDPNAMTALQAQLAAKMADYRQRYIAGVELGGL